MKNSIMIILISLFLYGCSCPAQVERTVLRTNTLPAYLPEWKGILTTPDIWREPSYIYRPINRTLPYDIDTIVVPILDGEKIAVEWRGATDEIGEADSLRLLIKRLSGKLQGTRKADSTKIVYIDTTLHIYQAPPVKPWWERQVDKILALVFLFGLLFLIVKLIIGKRNA